MTDMLVKLYDLPDLAPSLERMRAEGVDVRRGLAPEKHLVTAWVGEAFSPHWVSECEIAFARQPVSCFVAVEDNRPIGFACYDTTRRGVFGPTGVDEAARGRGVGVALLLLCLHDMFAQGYAYAVIGSAGPQDFYTRFAGATPIPDSTPGMYRGMLRRPSDDD